MKILPGRPRHKWKDNMVALKEITSDGVDSA
jgi:hypothetical protein